MDNEYKVIATKVTKRAYIQLKAIAERANIKVYALLQIVIDCYIKTFCEKEPINDYMREILCKFIDIDRAKTGFSLIAPILRNLSITKCLAIVSQAKKTIPEIVLIEKDGDSITQNINKDAILTEFLQAFSPKILRDLQMIQEREQMHNLTDALHFAINEIAQPKDPLHSEIEQLFTDANNLVLSAEIQPTGAQRGKSKKQLENLCAGAFEPKNYKRTYCRQYNEYEQAHTDFDPTEIYDPLKDYEPEFVPDYEPEFVPDNEPEFVPDYEPEYI